MKSILTKNIQYMYEIYKRQVANNSHQFIDWFYKEKKTNERFKSIYSSVDFRLLKVIVQDNDIEEIEKDEDLKEEILNKIEMRFETCMISLEQMIMTSDSKISLACKLEIGKYF